MTANIELDLVTFLVKTIHLKRPQHSNSQRIIYIKYLFSKLLFWMLKVALALVWTQFATYASPSAASKVEHQMVRSGSDCSPDLENVTWAKILPACSNGIRNWTYNWSVGDQAVITDVARCWLAELYTLEGWLNWLRYNVTCKVKCEYSEIIRNYLIIENIFRVLSMIETRRYNLLKKASYL